MGLRVWVPLGYRHRRGEIGWRDIDGDWDGKPTDTVLILIPAKYKEASAVRGTETAARDASIIPPVLLSSNKTIRLH